MRQICFLFLIFGAGNYSFTNKIIFFSHDSTQVAQTKDSLLKSRKDSSTISVAKDTSHLKVSQPLKKDTSKIETPMPRISDFDKIMKRNGDSILCNITSKNLYEVEYTKPKSKTKLKLSTANIKEIFYANGKYELIDNTPEKKKKDWTVAASEIDWKNVTITYEPTDVTGLIEKGQIDAYFEAKKMTSENEVLERNAYAILKKKAYSMKATIVLITDKKFNRMYGEMPSITIIGVAYGKE